MMKRVWAKWHLRSICDHCPVSKRHTRDILHAGSCFWYDNWKRGMFSSIPFWMGVRNFFRLYIFNKPIRICINGKEYEGYKFKD